MKNTKRILLGISLVFAGMSTFAQTYITDLSTGIDTSTGNRIYWPSNDQRWMVKKPNTGYQQVQVGTGRSYNHPYTKFDLIDQNVGWLTPHPLTQSAADALDATCNIPSPGCSNNYPGDFLDHNNSNTGNYIFRMRFVVNFPSCQKPNSLTLRVNRMAGTDIIGYMQLNNGAIGDLSNLTTSLVTGTTSICSSYQGHNAVDASYMVQSSSHQGCMPQYTISNINPSLLINGVNYIYVVVPKGNGNTPSAGFICNASLEYTFATEYPNLEVKESTKYTCAGLAYVKFKVINPTSSSTTYTANIYDFANLSTPVYTNTSVAANTLITVSVPVPATYTNYKVVVTKNGSGCGISTASKTLTIYNCSPSTFSVSTTSGGNNYFRIDATPDNGEEASTSGFESKWMLEELDPVTYDPIYTIDNPEGWNAEDGICLFPGFNPNNTYSGTIDPFSADVDFETGRFFGDRIYRITRATRLNGSEWDFYNVIVGETTEDILEEDERSQAGSLPEVKQAPGFTISPNPGNGLVQLTVTNNNPKTIEVFDVLGKRVFEKNSITEMQTVIDITAQPKGVYLVKVTDGTSVSTERIIKE